MRTSFLYFLSSITALALGFFIGYKVKILAAVETVAAGTKPDKPSPNVVAPSHSSIEELLRDSPRTILSSLSSNCYYYLTDEEIQNLASQLDLRKSSDRSLINAIASTTMRDKMWSACLTASVGRIPLEDLANIAKEALTSSPRIRFTPILAGIEAQGNAAQTLQEKWALPFIGMYLEFSVPKASSLEESLAIIPESSPEKFQIRQVAVEAWIKSHPTPNGLAEVLKSKGEDDGDLNACQYVWSLADTNTRSELLKTFDLLGPVEKNRALMEISQEVAPSDETEISMLLRNASSYSAQKRIVDNWLSQDNKDGAQRLLSLVDGNDTSLGKIATEVRKRASSDQSKNQEENH